MSEDAIVNRNASQTSRERLDATAIVITFNERKHIARCIERIRDSVKRVVVVDSFSTDGTQDIARAAGADVIEHPFVSHADQFNWGMRNCGVDTAWIIRLDADEYFDAPGLDALHAALPRADDSVGAFSIRRGVVFARQRIRFGGIGSVTLTRIWRAGAAEVEARWMDEQVIVHRGETRSIENGSIVDENLNNLEWWTAKHNGYTTRQMVEWMNAELGLGSEVDPALLNAKVRRKRQLRNGFYGRMPLFWRAIAYFLLRYFVLLGFLDGRGGFLFHFFQGLWNFTLVDAKMWEARELVKREGTDAFVPWVKTTYGLDLQRDD